MNNKRCSRCRWFEYKIYIVGIILLSLMSFMSYKFIYPLFKEHKQVLKLRESNFIPVIYPVAGKITGRFYDIRKENGTPHRHGAIDIACKINTKVVAAANGYVDNVEPTAYYGLKITIVHISRKHRYKTVYAHLYKVLVKENDYVIRNQPIGLSGNSGRSSGPHLHYEVWKAVWRHSNFFWKAVNPEPYCKGWVK